MTMTTEMYFCRSCKLPLVIDSSLEDLSHAQQNLLTLNYGERPASNLFQINSGLNIRSTSNSNAVSGTSENTNNSCYPLIPEEREKLFQEASNNTLHHLNRQKSDGIASSGLEDQVSAHGNDSGKLNDASFVYLQDKTQSDSDSYGQSTIQNLPDERNMTSKVEDKDPMNVVENTSDISERVESLEKIFDIISARYEIDYPVCGDCATTLINDMKTKYENLSKDKETYMQFLKKLTQQNGPSIEKTQKALEELERLKTVEADMLNEIKQEETRHLELNNEMKELENELRQLELEEQSLCLKQNEEELLLDESLDELERLKTQYSHNLNLLDSLRNTNVYDRFFEITNDDEFGRINGLRIGTLPDKKVTWHEINAGLGQVVLLLCTCLKLLDVELDGYRLIPMGSTSKIEKYVKENATGKIIKSVIQLHCTGEFSIGGFFSHNNLDNGMVALVEIIKQLSVHIKSLDSSFKLPYTLCEDKVAGFCIRPSSRSGLESWTKACSCLLVDVKWIMAFCVAVQDI